MSHHIHPHPLTIHDQYVEFRQQVAGPSSTLHDGISHQGPHRNDMNADEDLDMDAQLENVSPEK
jgi:hypothetical protein